MAREIRKHVEYYYDSHPTEEDLMGETAWHSRLIHYLFEVLNWLFHDQDCAIYENLNFYPTFEYHEYPVAPDLAVIKGIPLELVRSWSADRLDMPAHVVFEVLSDETWKKDLREKPAKYASLGVREYFAYDPYTPTINRATAQRLFGYRLDGRRQQMVEIEPDAAGWMWSEQLQCWLVPQGEYLRLYDRKRRLCLTEAQAEALLRRQAMERVAEQAEQAQRARRAEEEARRAEEEARRAEEAANKRAEEEARRADEEARKVQALLEKLRALGVHPDDMA